MRMSLFLISLSALYHQIALIRYMSNIYYGNMTYFIISVALLGFGASGTWLSLRRKKSRNAMPSPLITSSMALLTCSLSLLVTSALPLNLLYLFYDYRQILLLFIYSAWLFLPFFFCGLFIGAILISSKNKTGDYGINLLGSGAGGLVSLSLMYYIDPLLLPMVTLIPLAFSTVLLLKDYLYKKDLIFFISSWGATLISLVLFNISEPDQYKDISHYRILEKQGQAEFLASSLSPYGKMEAWYSPLSHSTLFAGLDNIHSPPEQITLFNDGDFSGSLFMAESAGQVRILTSTIQSLPYRILEKPEVLLVGDTGLTNLWLALLYKPAKVTLLLPDRYVDRLLKDDLKQWTAHSRRPEVKIISGDYRKFFIENRHQFDLIHIASAESLRGSMSGLNSFREDYLLTTDSISQAVESLKENGILAISRGKQLPAKDNAKIAVTMVHSGGKENLIQYQNYLAVISLFFKNPPIGDKGNLLDRAAASLNLTPFDWENSLQPSIFDLRSPGDNRPFFHSFFQWRTIDEYSEVYGSYWFRESHGGYMILVVTFLFITVTAFILILFPHILKRQPMRFPLLLYFPLIGFAFMFIEMVLIQKLSLFLGHSSFSISLVPSALLIFSGLGSLYRSRMGKTGSGDLLKAFLVVSFFTFASLIFSNPLLFLSAELNRISPLLLWICILAYCGICAFPMGWFFAPGLALLERKKEKSLPGAWALNGFASVAASPLAVIFSISFGFAAPLALAVLFYFCAVLLYHRYY